MSYYYDGDNKDADIPQGDIIQDEQTDTNESNQIKENRISIRKDLSTEMIMEVPDEEELDKNPFIYSHSVSVGLRSFVDNR